MSRNVIVAGLALGASLAAGLVWQAVELRRLGQLAETLETDLAELRRAHDALQVVVETRPPGPPAGGASLTEMEPPRGPVPRSRLVESTAAPGEPDPTVDTTAGEARPAPDPCAAACSRAMTCAMERCGVGTTATDPLVDGCRARCAEDRGLVERLSAGTDCEAVLDAARALLPAYADACR